MIIYYPPGHSKECEREKEGEREREDYPTRRVDLVHKDYLSAGVIIACDLNSLNPSIL